MEDSSEPYEPDTDNTGGGRCKSQKAFAARALVSPYSAADVTIGGAPRDFNPPCTSAPYTAGFYINIKKKGKNKNEGKIKTKSSHLG